MISRRIQCSCSVFTYPLSGTQNKFGNEEVARASFVQLFRALQPEGAKHPMARHLLRQIERESCRQSGEPDGSGCIGFEQFMEVRVGLCRLCHCMSFDVSCFLVLSVHAY